MTDTILQELNLLQSQGGGAGFQSCCYQHTAQIHNGIVHKSKYTMYYTWDSTNTIQTLYTRETLAIMIFLDMIYFTNLKSIGSIYIEVPEPTSCNIKNI